MNCKDKSKHFNMLSDVPVNNHRQQVKLLHLSKHRHSLALDVKREQFIRQKRIYESVDNSECNRLSIASTEDQSVGNHKDSGNQINFIVRYPYYNFITISFYFKQM